MTTRLFGAVVLVALAASCGSGSDPQATPPLVGGAIDAPSADIPSAPPVPRTCRLVSDPSLHLDVEGSLESIAVVSATDVWAVGDNFDEGLALHFDGARWTEESVPKAGGGLKAVVIRSANDGWAVGGADTNATILRWNGAAWKVAARFDGPSGISFEDVEVARDHGWAVGSDSPDGVHDRPVVARYDGRAWKRISVPRPGTGRNRLNGVAVTSKKDAWAVGVTSDDGDEVGKPYVLRWNGSRWSFVRAPVPKGAMWSELFAVTSFSARDVWAVGHYDDAKGRHTLALRWDGSRWRIIPSPAMGASGTRGFAPPFGPVFYDVVGASGSDVWAVGAYNVEAGKGGELFSRALAQHWDGKRWTEASGLETNAVLEGISDPTGAVKLVVGNQSDDVTRPLVAKIVCL